MIRTVKLRLKIFFIQAVMCAFAFVQLFYMCSSCSVLVYGLEHRCTYL